MSAGRSNAKRIPKKYHPRGLKILHEDPDIIVVDKEEGLLTIGNDRVKDRTAHFLLNNYVKKGSDRSNNRVFIVHRLDKDTSGVLVFAKSEEAKRYLQDEWQKFDKKYLAVVHGRVPEKEGEISSYLAENSIHRMYSTKDESKGKLAKTGFKVLKTTASHTLLEIELFTGRKNQIRVHFAEKGFPVVGDKMYGRKEKGKGRLALHATSLTIVHPHTKKPMTFTVDMPAYFKSLLK